MDNNELDDLASRAGFVVNMLGQIVTPAPSEDARQPLRLFSELLQAAERERFADLCRKAMPQPVANWSDAQIVATLRGVLAQVVGPNV